MNISEILFIYIYNLQDIIGDFSVMCRFGGSHAMIRDKSTLIFRYQNSTGNIYQYFNILMNCYMIYNFISYDVFNSISTS